MSIRVEPVTRWQAHPADQTAFRAFAWPRPRRWAALLYALEVVAQAAFLIAFIGAFLWAALVAGAAMGVDMGSVPR